MHPNLLHFGHIILPTYGLLAAVGLMAALSLSLRTAVAAGLSPDDLWNAGVVTVVLAFVLSRVLLVLLNLKSFLSYPILLLTVPSLTPIGVLLTAVAAMAYLRFRKIRMRAALDAWAPCGTLLWSFLALGHFFEGSDPGLPTGSPIAIAVPPGPAREYPVALYAAVCGVALTVLLLWSLRRRSTGRNARSVPTGNTAALGLTGTGVVQFLLSFYRQPAPPSDLRLMAVLDPIQWVSLGLIVAGSMLFMANQRPGPYAL